MIYFHNCERLKLISELEIAYFQPCEQRGSMDGNFIMWDCWSVHRFGPDWNILPAIGRITMKFGTDIHG